jgi:hypothetical protein
MSSKWMIGAILAAALAIPIAARAHEGHTHKVMGTVSTIAGNQVMVKTTDGKTVTVMLDAKTKITQGKTKLDAKSLKVGTRIVAEGAESKGTVTATSIQVGTAPAPTSRAK